MLLKLKIQEIISASKWVALYIFLVSFFVLMIFISPPLAFVFSMFLAMIIPQFWTKNTIYFLFLFLGVFIPLFPDLGVAIGGRVLNWFDLFLLGFGGWNILHSFSEQNKKRIDSVLIGSACFLSVLFLLIFRSPDQMISLRDFVSYLVNFFLTYYIMEDLKPKQLEKFVAAILASSCVITLIAFWQKLNGYTFPSEVDGVITYRLGVPGTFDDSLVLSMYAGFMVILACMGYVRFARYRLFFSIAILCNLLSLKLALSRNGMFILGVALGVFILFRFFEWIKDRRKSQLIPITLVFLPILSISSLYLMPKDVYHRIVSVFYLFSGSKNEVIMYNIRSTLGRLENYKAAVKLFLENPIEGIGLGMYPHLTKFHDADGFYTGLMAETGLIGCMGFSFFVLGVLYLIKKSYPKLQGESKLFYQLFISLFVALMLVSFFEPVFKVQIITFYFFFFLKNLKQEAQSYESS
ncbi:MAG: O-antigen ligase family protein [Candidatus Cloacimonetes bacterium]|nr:O-antigen ligase family protein [Candidatus Cloacimonadota bacterium]